MKFKNTKQYDSSDCGAACLHMITEYYKQNYSFLDIREMLYISKLGVSLFSISQSAEKLGFKTIKVQLSIESLVKHQPFPCILYVDNNHYVVLYKIEKKYFGKKTIFHIADPAYGNIKLNKSEFGSLWLFNGNGLGVALLLTPVQSVLVNSNDKLNFSKILFKYYYPFKKYYFQLILGLIALSFLTFVLPFLSKSIVDVGIANKSLKLVFVIFCAQVLLVLAQQGLNIVRTWLLLHINVQISINIISDFLTKLMRIPVKFFIGKSEGDFMQRIQDHSIIEDLLTNGLLNAFFSVVTLIVFSSVLIMFNVSFFIIFFIGSLISFVWVTLFINKRRKLNYIRFRRNKENQNNILEILHGMEEIKLNNNDIQKKWEWERIQLKLFRLNIQNLKLEQIQSIGNFTITQIKNTYILFLTASEVVNNEITIGTMMSISFIIGLLNAPIDQLVSFFRSSQDALLSLERLSEINNIKDEYTYSINSKVENIDPVETKNIVLKNVSFSYEGISSNLILNNLNISFYAGKTTAIVGPSGCGKTTLMKLLLGYYPPLSGKIFIGDTPLEQIDIRYWRDNIGSVLQEGFIFSDSIKNNIIMKNEFNDNNLKYALEISNCNEFVNKLPFGVNTKVGKNGLNLSVGQRQRILIARAVYKNPKIIIFDEATSSLDAKNEFEITQKLQHFLNGRTTIIIAHRLSTVKNANNILVINNGEIVESGNHDSLITSKGYYYKLINNQLV